VAEFAATVEGLDLLGGQVALIGGKQQIGHGRYSSRAIPVESAAEL